MASTTLCYDICRHPHQWKVCWSHWQTVGCITQLSWCLAAVRRSAKSSSAWKVRHCRSRMEWLQLSTSCWSCISFWICSMQPNASTYSTFCREPCWRSLISYLSVGLRMICRSSSETSSATLFSGFLFTSCCWWTASHSSSSSSDRGLNVEALLVFLGWSFDELLL